MKNSHVQILFTLLATAALAACGGGGATSSQVLPLRASHAQPQTAILSNIVGVGDSLTAGYQSNGFLGAPGVRTPTGYSVPQGQENGWWADLYEQASGEPLDTAISKMYDPSTSPLPLIAKPGLNNQIIPYTSLFPIQEQKSGDICTDNNGFNEASYHLKGNSRVRMDPDSTEIRDVGIPGLTLHEANVLHEPQTDTCKFIPGIPGLLSMVVSDESATFWPVLGNFTRLGPNLTDVNAAASRHPTLATVWLGANDVLKYMGSGGRFVGGDRNAAQAEEDLRATFSTLEHSGARVVVANLPNILETGYFQRVDNPKSFKDCPLTTYAWCLINVGIGVPKQAVTAIANRYHLSTPNGCVPASENKPCGYLTLQGAIEIINYYLADPPNYPDLDCAVPAPHCKAVPGSGLGNYYITPEFAGKIQALNDAINLGIDDAATASHVPLVNVQDIFHGIAGGDPSNRYFKLAASINPGVCCTLGYLYGMLSFDGLHPSNTGYALIAYVFIDVINKAYGTHIPEIDVKAAYNGKRCHNSTYCYPDPYAPPNDISF
ncbi:MAG TPA: SGNH/GDSL hydrolase family protein [Candidatus Cybelea sp.]|nr:SGNH/GDSL hydrolase family protein [Candidatus Cybelea sp.]